MNQVAIGAYIAQKRREKNLTQEMLASKLSVSNKTVSKWERGKCMPDYSVIEKLCELLGVALSQLLAAKDDSKTSDDNQTLGLLEYVARLEKEKNILYGIMLIVFGIALSALSKSFGGSHIKDFISGVLMGLSIGQIMVGIAVVGKHTLH